jgi:AraC-like DNA-binding protein
MRFIRKKQTWRVVDADNPVDCCLERLAYQRSYRVADVCTALGGSHRRFYNIFMRDVGLPPKTWMQNERMVVARRMLEGGQSISEVTMNLGFLSIATFRRAFLKAHGVTPQAFLKDRKFFAPHVARF